MTQQELEIIINSNLSSFEKSKLIKLLYDVNSYLEGGSIQETDDKKFKKFLESLPKNLGTLTDDYNMKRYWELNDKPKDFQEAMKKNMFVKKEDGWSITYNEDRDILEWMTSKDHPIIISTELRRHKEGNKIEKSIKTLNPTEIIRVGNLEFDVEIANTEAKRQEGLSRITKLNDGEGMLFIFDNNVTNYFTMKDTSIDLDIVFIDDDEDVIEVHSCKAHSTDPIVCSQPYRYVLEVNINSNILSGDELEDTADDDYTDEDKEEIKHSRMLVLDSNGNVQMKLVGGERIVSMIKTRQLIKAALKAYKTDNDADYKRVGRLIFKELDALDNRNPLYVDK